jgi:hypothetical protein
MWPWFNEEERLEAMAYEEKTRANAQRKRLCKAHTATKNGGGQGERPLTMSIDPTYEELLDAGFNMHEPPGCESARHDILESGTKERLVQLAASAARKQKFDKHKPRGLYARLAKIFYPQPPSLAVIPDEIGDAIDPSWPLLPSPSELRDDAGFDEINGHLTLINFSLECHLTVFSTDKASQSHFLLFQEPFCHKSTGETYNWGPADLTRMKRFSVFTNNNLSLDNGPPQDQFGLFITNTKNWVGNARW